MQKIFCVSDLARHTTVHIGSIQRIVQPPDSGQATDFMGRKWFEHINTVARDRGMGFILSHAQYAQ